MKKTISYRIPRAKDNAYRILSILHENLSIPRNYYRHKVRQEVMQKTAGRGYIINFGRAGFFSNFFEVLGYIEWCERNDLIPLAYGGKYCNSSCARNMYWSDVGYNGAYNVWEYFFEPLSGISINSPIYPDNYGFRSYDKIFTPNGDGIGLTETISPAHLANVEQERSKDLNMPPAKIGDDLKHFAHSKGYSKVWLLARYQRDYPSVKYRQLVNKLIRRHVKLKPIIQERIDKFYNSYMSKEKVIGLHIRKTDNIGSEHLEVDLNKYFLIVDSYSTEHLIYAATDSKIVLDKLKEKYGNRLIYNDCIRSENRSAIHTNFKGKRRKGNPQLGEQVLMDAVLLSRTNFFVHGLSSVASAALFLNPNLEHCSIWETVNKGTIFTK